ncbi:MAG: winged helix-turn-helix transcriptional regulator [Alphaproteobacteria bacterium]|nr:winged helix-turn-helix transcriptional regulator [Alphaproteobacteria bacterium]
MSEQPNRPETEITLDLLSAVENDRRHSQRSLAQDLGIALGLTNAYVKRCIKRGWIKASQAPPNRYVYYLTPRGFSEKSRLTARYLKSSFSFYRQARNELDSLLESCVEAGHTRVALAGRSEIAEIAVLCAGQYPIEIAAVIDAGNEPAFLGIPVVKSVDDLPRIDTIIVTDTKAGQETYDRLVAQPTRVAVCAPRMLRVVEHTRSAAK